MNAVPPSERKTVVRQKVFIGKYERRRCLLGFCKSTQCPMPSFGFGNVAIECTQSVGSVARGLYVSADAQACNFFKEVFVYKWYMEESGEGKRNDSFLQRYDHRLAVYRL